MYFTKHDYHLKGCQDRLEILLDALRYDTFCNKKFFSFYDRILINRQRSSLLTFTGYLAGDLPQTATTMVELPAELDQKIDKILTEITATSWHYTKEDL